MARNPVHMFWGIISVLVGAWFGYVTVRNLFSFNWRSIANAECLRLLAMVVPFAALAVYFIWLGKNQLRRAGGQEVPRPRVRWGRLLLGFLIVFFILKGHFAPGPNAHKPVNESEAQGMFFFTMTIAAAGTLLMAFALRPAKPKTTEQVSSTDIR